MPTVRRDWGFVFLYLKILGLPPAAIAVLWYQSEEVSSSPWVWWFVGGLWGAFIVISVGVALLTIWAGWFRWLWSVVTAFSPLLYLAVLLALNFWVMPHA